MFSKIVIASALAMAAVASAAPIQELQYQTMFASYVKTHNKEYTTEETFQRYNNFKKAHKEVQEHNASGATYTKGINRFSDMSKDEFKKVMLSGLKQHPSPFLRSMNLMKKDPNFVAPASIDWVSAGAVTPVKDQGQCGSCWAFSTTGGIEGRTFTSTKKLTSLSEEDLVECSTQNSACNGGLMDYGFEYVVGSKGLCTEAAYSYTSGGGSVGSCTESSCTKTSPISGYKDVAKGDEAALMQALADGPVSIAVDAGSFQTYSGGILSGNQGNQLDHGVLLVGAGEDNGTKYWKIKNSWAATWGEEGYIRVERGIDICGLADAASYPTV